MNRRLGLEGGALGPMAADMAAGESVAKEFDRSVGLVQGARVKAAELIAQADLVERVYQGEFLRDVEAANRLAISVAAGDTSSLAFDAQSLGEHGDNPATVRIYLSSFMVQDPSQTYPFAKLTFPTSAVIPYNGKEHHVSPFTTAFQPLESYNFSPNFNPNVTSPTLVDPQLRTFADLQELEAIDPGHAEQLMEAYRMAAREQKEKKNPQAKFKDPLIVRMVAILPTGYDYLTDFLPQVDMPKRPSQSWDPYLLVDGALNPSGNYLNNDTINNRDKVVLNRDGKEAALRLSRPLPGQVAEEQAQALVPLTSHEMNRMAVMLFPYEFHAKPLPSIDYGYYGGAPLSLGEGTKGAVTRGANIGGAVIGAGASGWAGADKRSETILGDRFVPKTDGQPIIYSVRLLTAQRDPDVAIS